MKFRWRLAVAGLAGVWLMISVASVLVAAQGQPVVATQRKKAGEAFKNVSTKGERHVHHLREGAQPAHHLDHVQGPSGAR